MANEKQKVYFMKMRVRKMLYQEEFFDIPTIKKEIFDVFADEYQKAESTDNYASFTREYKTSNEIFAITKLHYRGDILCGIIGRFTNGIKGFIRETNLQTFDTKEIVPTDPRNKFEEYTYFAISVSTLRIAYIPNRSIGPNIPLLVLNVLRQNSRDGIYEIELWQLFDRDIKKKLQSMGPSVKVTGWIEGKEALVSGGMPSLKRFEELFGSRVTTKIRFSSKCRKPLTEEDAAEIIRLSSSDDGYTSVCFEDEEDEQHEVIDVIKRVASLSREIILSPAERKDSEIIWKRLCHALENG